MILVLGPGDDEAEVWEIGDRGPPKPGMPAADQAVDINDPSPHTVGAGFKPLFPGAFGRIQALKVSIVSREAESVKTRPSKSARVNRARSPMLAAG